LRSFVPVLFSCRYQEDLPWRGYVLFSLVGHDSFAAQNVEDLFVVVNVHLCSCAGIKSDDSNRRLMCLGAFVYERFRVDWPPSKMPPVTFSEGVPSTSITFNIITPCLRYRPSRLFLLSCAQQEIPDDEWVASWPEALIIRKEKSWEDKSTRKTSRWLRQIRRFGIGVYKGSGSHRFSRLLATRPQVKHIQLGSLKYLLRLSMSSVATSLYIFPLPLPKTRLHL